MFFPPLLLLFSIFFTNKHTQQGKSSLTDVWIDVMDKSAPLIIMICYYIFNECELLHVFHIANCVQ